MMLWLANYHPDSGQLFFPLEFGCLVEATIDAAV